MKYAMQMKTCIKLKEILCLKVSVNLKMLFQRPKKERKFPRYPCHQGIIQNNNLLPDLSNVFSQSFINFLTWFLPVSKLDLRLSLRCEHGS